LAPRIVDGKGWRVDTRVKRAMALIEKQSDRDLCLADIAAHFNLSPSRLRHLVKDHTGTTLIQYRKTLRMEKARRLLETTFLNIKEIMLEVGFKDESNFVRDFKKQHGLTPARYRETYLKGIK
jgi:AraC-like DNA-binding protein